MSKRIASIVLSICLCLTLLPTAAFAADSNNKITITTVDELLQFAKAVDNGEYDDKTDAAVSLDADLDLTGIAWTPIGSVFAADGTLLHYFSGKFYGNGHTISNLDFSENYGKAEYPSFGFFSEVYGAEISGLTIQGKLDVSNSEYIYFGTVAGVAGYSKISDCVSNVSFTDTDKYINGTVALCGYAIYSTIEYCQNKGDFSITMDCTSSWMGGIVGVAENSTVQYCANTGNMTSWTPCTGGIVGQLYQASKIINCYSTGKMVPLGRGNTDFGGIAGIVGANTEIRHCYFAGEMDLSQYTATTPYKRLGGIAGGVSSDTPAFENNYFVETENVSACFKYQNAGTEKSLDSMKTEDFFNEITAAGGNYRFNSNGTPILPAPKYAVSFVVTPAELTNVIIKVDGQPVTNPANLEAGTYQVEVSADNCEVFNSNITITADTATHTHTIAMTYAVLVRKPSGSSTPSYPVTVSGSENGSVTVRPKYAEKGDTVTVTVTPDEGYILDSLTVLNKNGKEIEVTDKGDGKYTFKMPAGKVTVSATFAPEKTAADYFADVSADSYYADAVLWAAKNGVTGGIGNNLFAPDASCTRAQIVTFLWRAAGSPEPKAASSFADVPTNAYYAKAVAWAVENGITGGIGNNLFAPDQTCTRAQAVAFLFRYAASQGMDAVTLQELVSGYGDAAQVSGYALPAFNWALAKGIVQGYNGNLMPNNDCTRAQIVTMLYRLLGTN